MKVSRKCVFSNFANIFSFEVHFLSFISSISLFRNKSCNTHTNIKVKVGNKEQTPRLDTQKNKKEITTNTEKARSQPV